MERTMMDHAECKQVATALENWFASQDINPRDSGVCMMVLIARTLVRVSKDPAKLQVAINLFRALLSVEIAELLHHE